MVTVSMSGARIVTSVSLDAELVREGDRALIEGLGFGTRIILDTLERAGLRVRSLSACVSLAEKNPLLMQIFADVSGRPISVAGSPMVTALGAALLGAVGAGERGGHATLRDAAAVMVPPPSCRYSPDPKQHERYSEMFASWASLHDRFGRTP